MPMLRPFLLLLLASPALLTSLGSVPQPGGERSPRDAGQPIKVKISEGCVQAGGASSDPGQSGGKELVLEPGSPLVLTHRIWLTPVPGSGVCSCEVDFAALRARIEGLEREVSELREKCGGSEGGCCTSQQSKGAGCTLRPECPNECSDQGRCEDGKCVCFPGFSGADCSTSDCPGNCNDKGSCVDGKCVCDTGFTGPDCSAKACPGNCNDKGRCVDGKCVCDAGLTGPDCSAKSCPGDCSNKGRCVNGKCVCSTGFTGPDCSAKACPGNCNNKGRCVNGKCVCEAGFTSADCSSKACPGNCNKKGRCVDGKCVCNPSFTGPDCSVKACPGNCNNKGKCVNGKCVCDAGFTGPDCSTKSCPGNCKNKGRCVDGKCVCSTGFTGPDCSTKSCPGNCSDNGRCVDGKCVCDAGFTGPDCSTKSCPGDCSDKGQCVDGKCVCDTGFTGPDCSLKACPGNCKNKGRCVDGKCVCSTGFTGPDCSTKSCPGDCSDKGQCVDGKCVCDTGFTGPDCSLKACPGNCNNKGRCVDGKCVCDVGFSGPDCAAKSCPSDCSDKGQCVDGKCVCDAGFTGADCSTKSCPGDCSDKGQCVDGKCVCDAGFTGPDCSTKSCPGNCNDKGRCVDGKCVCDVGFSGPDCAAKTCPNNCSSKGRCVRGRCVCRRGSTGPDCSQCEAGLTGSDCNTAMTGVSKLSTKNITEDSVTLIWTQPPVQYDTYYIIFTSKKESGQITTTVSGGLTSYVQSGLAPGQEYTVTIQGELGGRRGVESAAEFETLISGPKNLRVVKTSTTSVVIQWEQSQGEIDRYRLTVTPSEGAGSTAGGQALTLPPERDSAQIDGVVPGRLYDIALVAEKGRSRSKPATVRATPGETIPRVTMATVTTQVAPGPTGRALAVGEGDGVAETAPKLGGGARVPVRKPGGGPWRPNATRVGPGGRPVAGPLRQSPLRKPVSRPLPAGGRQGRPPVMAGGPKPERQPVGWVRPPALTTKDASLKAASPEDGDEEGGALPRTRHDGSRLEKVASRTETPANHTGPGEEGPAHTSPPGNNTHQPNGKKCYKKIKVTHIRIGGRHDEGTDGGRENGTIMKGGAGPETGADASISPISLTGNSREMEILERNLIELLTKRDEDVPHQPSECPAHLIVPSLHPVPFSPLTDSSADSPSKSSSSSSSSDSPSQSSSSSARRKTDGPETGARGGRPADRPALADVSSVDPSQPPSLPPRSSETEERETASSTESEFTSLSPSLSSSSSSTSEESHFGSIAEVDPVRGGERGEGSKPDPVRGGERGERSKPDPVRGGERGEGSKPDPVRGGERGERSKPDPVRGGERGEGSKPDPVRGGERGERSKPDPVRGGERGEGSKPDPVRGGETGERSKPDPVRGGERGEGSKPDPVRGGERGEREGAKLDPGKGRERAADLLLSETDQSKTPPSAEGGDGIPPFRRTPPKVTPLRRPHPNMGPSQNRTQPNTGAFQNRLRTNLGALQNRARPHMRPLQNRTRPNMGPFHNGTRPNMGPFQNGTRPNMGPFKNGTRPNMGPFKNGTRPNMGPFQNRTRPNMGPFQNRPRPNTVAIQDRTQATNMGPIQDRTRPNMGHIQNRTRPHLRPPQHPSRGPQQQPFLRRPSNGVNGTDVEVHTSQSEPEGVDGTRKTGADKALIKPSTPLKREQTPTSAISQSHNKVRHSGEPSEEGRDSKPGHGEKESQVTKSPEQSDSERGGGGGGASEGPGSDVTPTAGGRGRPLDSVGVENVTSRGFAPVWDTPQELDENIVVTRRENGSTSEEEEEEETEEERKGGEIEVAEGSRGPLDNNDLDLGEDKRGKEGKSDVVQTQRADGGARADPRVFSHDLPGEARSFPFQNLPSHASISLSLVGRGPGLRSKIHRLVINTGPEPPTDLTFSEVAEDSLTVSWTRPQSAVSGFKITYTHAHDGEPVSVSVGSQDSTVGLSKLSPGSSYEVSVISVQGLDESDPITDFVTTLPDPPTDLRAVNVTDTKALLLWRPALATVDRYVITYGSEKGPTLTVTVTGNAAEQPLNGLQGGATYTVTISSQLGDLSSAAASTSFSTTRGSGGDPRDLTASQVTPRSALVSWTAPSAAVGSYRLTYLTGGQEMKEVTLDPTVTEYKLPRLHPSSKYTVQLQGERGGRFTPAISTEFTTGTLRFPYPSDCSQERLNGLQESGEVEVFPRGREGAALLVYCDMETDGGGWTVFQRRTDGKTNFYQSRKVYNKGFGDVSGEFWLGNEHLHTLTSMVPMTLHIDLRAGDESVYAKYSSFSVGRKTYVLKVSGYSGTAGDSMSYHNDCPFTTRDYSPNPFSHTNCAVSYKGGWWYRNCHEANLNGLYGATDMHQGIHWNAWKGKVFSVPFTEMKFRPTSFNPLAQG